MAATGPGPLPPGQEPAPASLALTRLGALLILALVGLGPVFPSLTWLAGAALVGLGLLLWPAQRGAGPPEREDRIIGFALLALFLAVALSVLAAAARGAGAGWGAPWSFLSLPLAALLLRVLPRISVAPALWAGATLGAVGVGLAGVRMVPGDPALVAAGPLLGALALILVDVWPGPPRPLRWVAAGSAFGLGALAAALSPGPGWLALPLLGPLLAWHRWPGRLGALALALIAVLVLLGLFGLRQALVAAPALDAALAAAGAAPGWDLGHLWLGHGWPPQGAEAGPVAHWRASQYLLTLHAGGLVGLAALLSLFVASAGVFARAARSLQPQVRTQGAAGLAVVAGFAAPALVGPVLAPPASIALLASLLALVGVALARARRIPADPAVARRHTLSAIIITKNEADRIEPCLQSIAGWVDEIVVLDSGSDDDTVAICRRYTDRVEVTDWPGFGPQKQRALERARCDWVLSIDADERVTPRLREDILRLLQLPQPPCQGYGARWAVMVAGQRLDFGRSARAPMRLFRRAGARFSDDVVHERILLPDGARIGRLDGRLLHYSHRDLGHHLAKVAEYAWLGARRRHARGRRGAGLSGALLRGLWTFCWVYFVRLGLLDGRAGFLVAALYGQTTFNTYAALWSLRRQPPAGGD